MYVDDVVDAFVRAAERGGGLLMNIGTGTETSVLDLYGLMAELVGFRIRAPLRAGTPRRARALRAGSGRAAIHLGWKPWTTLEEGLELTLDWFRPDYALAASRDTRLGRSLLASTRSLRDLAASSSSG